MSLINDALRRASQSEKNRPQPVSTASGMEPVPATQGSRVTAILILVVVVVLLLAGWFFWQWWNIQLRNDTSKSVIIAPVPTVSPPEAPPVASPPAPDSKPVVAAPANPAPVAVTAPAVAVAPPPVVVATPSVVPAPTVAPVKTPPAAAPLPIVWPAELKVGAIFFSTTNPRVLISGNLYGLGDEIHGMVLKKIEKDRVTVEWNGHTKEVLMEGQ